MFDRVLVRFGEDNHHQILSAFRGGIKIDPIG